LDISQVTKQAAELMVTLQKESPDGVSTVQCDAK